MQISGQTFLVAGGGSGLGAACARRLAAQGGRIVVADLQAEAGAQIAAELGSAARFVRTDVTDPEQVQAAVDAARQAFGCLQGVVQTAGVLHAERALGRQGPHRLETFARVVQVNLVGAFNVIRLAAAAIAESPPQADGERGVIVCTSSIAAFESQIGQAAYAASKGGLAAMMLPLARELGPRGIRVLAIAPGVFDTPLLAGLDAERRAALAADVVFPPRLGQPEEFAQLVEQAFENRLLNGCVLRLDGGLRMR